MTPYDEVKASFAKGLLQPMTPGGERCLRTVFGSTIANGLEHGRDWGKNREWLLRVAEKFGRAAQRFAGEGAVTWTHVARAANSVIPPASVVCAAAVAVKEMDATRGDWCLMFEEVPEVEPTP